jgi:hypothetical protein
MRVRKSPHKGGVESRESALPIKGRFGVVAGAPVDRYRFAARLGQKVAETEGSGEQA